MTSREKVLALLHGEKIDGCLPVFTGMNNFTLEGLASVGCSFDEAHRDADKMAGLALSSWRLYGYEAAVVPFDMGVEAEALGGKVNFYPGQAELLFPTMAEKPLQSPEELAIPSDAQQRGRLPLVREAIGRLRREGGEGLPVGAWVLGPYTLAGQLMDVGQLLRLSLKEPDKVKAMLEQLAGFVAETAQGYLAAGADYITVREMGASPNVVSPRIFSALVAPSLQEVFAAVKGPAILHICGDATLILPAMARVGAAALSIDSATPTAKAREILGGDVILLGNIDPYHLLVNGSPDEVASKVREALDGGADALWPGCDIWPTAPRANLEAMIREGKGGRG